MKLKLKPLAAAAAAMSMMYTLAPATAAAQSKADDASATADQTVTITGIRASIAKSMAVKRNADTNVEVVSAEDVGKMPDKNIADALSRLPGVNVQYGGALAMDEAERVAVRGTSPNLNLVTVNGHSLSAGDWHLGDQASSGRSVGFGLMPSQLIGQSIVYKTGRADVTEGGVSGSVDIITRKPLDFKNSLNGEVALGVAHATLAKKTDPQASGLLAWKNEAKNFGVLLQLFKEDRHLRRDGQEIFAYDVLTQAQATAAGQPSLAGKRMASSLNAAMFEGKRQRQGGYVGLQYKDRDIEVNASGFHAELKADNYNSSAYALPSQLVRNGYQIQNPVVDGAVITSATLVRPAGSTAQVVGLQFDHFYRMGAKSTSDFLDLDGKWRVNQDFTLHARAGSTEGKGLTPSEPSLVYGLISPSSVKYSQAANQPAQYSVLNASGQQIDLANASNYALMSNLAPAVESIDKERYFHLDGQYSLDSDLIKTIKFGGRGTKHERQFDRWEGRYNVQDNASGPITPSPFTPVSGGLLVTQVAPPSPATRYPGNWANGVDGNFPRDYFRFDMNQMREFADKNVNWDRTLNHNYTSGYSIEEDIRALYGMAEFELNPQFSGNFGVRWVETKLQSTSYQQIPAATCAPMRNCAVPGAIVGSRLGSYVAQTVETTTKDLLPSLNVRWDLNNDLIARAALTRTLGRPNYNELAGAVILDDLRATGSSGNPGLKPITSNNADATLAWYFAPRAMVSGGVFSQHLHDYVKTGTSVVDYFNISQGKITPYTVTSRKGVKATLRGFEAALELPIAAGFGFGANGTYVKSKDVDGVELLGTSKRTYNLRGFYEDDKISASLAWNYRSDYAIGFIGDGTNNVLRDAAGNITQYNGQHRYAGEGSLSLSLGYKFTPSISIHFDANNLNDPVRHTYYITENAPGYWHQNGRQYFLNLRMKY
ncbi:TonB-dependent receptor [Massilia endophytica]|uniref:TonB-dependent receptor n=1 Tax=Massilia endophytica TaxID=2899220 RepID=UPI001E4EAE95|nr:TonB-dependent receptor [Massilia endophytica]UGQ46976.1 TonB-dependent receptor [Massilia endophytica]